MAVTAQQIIDKARALLIDQNATKRWSDAELLQYLSDGQRVISAAVPSASGKIVAHQLVSGTRQTIPSDGHMLLGVVRNLGTDGAKPGRAIRIISREIIDAQNPDWHSDPKSSVTYNYIFDPQDPRAFYAYPPSNGLGYVEINYSQIPPELASLASTVTVQEIYHTALLDYTMFRAHQKDSEFAGGQQVAALYFQAFSLFITARTRGESEESPNLQLTPFNPAVRGASK